jgi:aspartyl-tRNA(Asn)/glutamyl-tRNA(Gln) amidotransferase subunit B
MKESAYEAVIGLEVHAQLLTASKIFCGCSTKFGSEPNTQTCQVCLGMPGVLPVLNRRAVEFAIRTAIAVGSSIPKVSVFARKNYFYPDLPKGYQISQFEAPLALGGSVEIETRDAGNKPSGMKKIALTRIHMEEDAGKLMHGEAPGEHTSSFVDLNRTGVPLMEIVSEPEMRTPEEAAEYLKRLRNILVYLDVCDGNMEEGSFRCDANVSVRKKGETKLGTKAELKNMNSFRFVQKGLEYEIKRQIETLESGGRVVQETRLFDPQRGITASMRSKEEAHDYRYFPEPDLIPLKIDDGWIEEIRKKMPELPDAKRDRFVSQYGLPVYDAGVLTASRQVAKYYEECVGFINAPKQVSNWIMTEVLRMVRDDSELKSFKVTPEKLAELIKLIEDGTISGKIAKEICYEVAESGGRPSEIVAKSGLKQVTDEGEIIKIAQSVIDANPKQASGYREGKESLMGFFVGQVMKATGGKANPKVVNEVLGRLLKGS